MLPRNKGLTKKEFQGKRPRIIYKGVLLDIASLDKEDQTKTRFACVISKKTFKKAVERNKVRRRVYSALGALQEQSLQKNYILYPKKDSLNSEYQDIITELSVAFATL